MHPGLETSLVVHSYVYSLTAILRDKYLLCSPSLLMEEQLQRY